MVGINRHRLRHSGRLTLPAKVAMAAAAILLWWFWRMSSNSSDAEELQLRTDRVNRPNRPAEIKFTPNHDKFAQQELPPSSSSSSNNNTISCTYKSLSDLTEGELQPLAGPDNPRHMMTPPLGGKVSLVCCATTAGALSIVAHSGWAPIGAQRFLEMVGSKYFDAGVPLFRCIHNFLCQFGISSDPSLATKFKDTIPDDPNWLPEGPEHRKNADGVARFAEGYLAYAGSGKNSRNKQLIMALKPNGPLAGGSPWEVPWGELVGADSFETLSKIYTGYEDHGPKQGRLMKEGVTEALRQEFPELDYITSCQLLDERIQEEPFYEPGGG
jgi:peptidyl-prolyl cis-trans isomerase A (cyclophilin A)